MKKKAICALGLALVLTVTLVAVYTGNMLKLEDFTWTLSTVQDQDGNVVACGPENSFQYPGAQEVSLLCTAQGKEICFHTDTEETTGTYRQTQQNWDERLYELDVKEWGWGYAVCAYTEFDTGERLPTLVMTFPKDYTLTFTGTRSK